MAEKRVNIRLAAVGGKQVKAEFEGIGDAGKRGFRKVSKEAEIANAKLAKVAKRAKIVAATMAAAATAAGVAMVKSSLDLIDQQAKLAASLGTTTESMQILQRAADLSGVSLGEMEQATIQLTKRLSQAAGGTGPAVKALERLGLSAGDLVKMPIDQKISTIQDAIKKFVPEAEQAAVASKIFGDRAGLIFSRVDSAAITQATKDVRDFGVAVTEADAAQIQRTNDALTRMGLVWRGIANQLAVAAAPALEAVANGFAAIARKTGPLGQAIKGLFDNLGQIVSIAGTFAAIMAGRWVVSMAAAALGVAKLTFSMNTLKAALTRTGIGLLIVGIGEAVYWFNRLVTATGGWGAALQALGDLASGVWEGIKTSAQSIAPAIGAVWEKVKAGVFRMLGAISEAWSAFLGRLGASLDGVPGMSSVVDGLNEAAANAIGKMAEYDAKANAAEAANARLAKSAADLREQGWEKVTRALKTLMLQMDAANAELEDGTKASDKLAEALKRVEDVAKRSGGAAKAKTDEVSKSLQMAKQVSDRVSRGFEDAFTALVTGAGSARDAVRALIADLARMAAQSAFRSLGFDSLIGGLFGAKVNHAGGMAGTGPTRQVPAAAFIGAPRMHRGGFVGLRPDEVPTILQRGERVLSRREVAAGAGAGAAPVNITIQTRDAESFRQSRTQIAADIARAVALGRRGL